MLVNGQEMEFEDGITVAELMKRLNMEPKNLVIKVDFKMIKPFERETTVLNNNSRVDMFTFVGGG